MANNRNGRMDKERRRNEANIRNSVWAAFSPERQLNLLDNLFGQGLGAAKQRRKIAKKIK